MAGYYDRLLKVCGFEDDEIDTDRPRIERVLQKLELGPDDMTSAENWLKEIHGEALKGLRKVLSIWLKELFDLVLAKNEGKKLVYYGFPTITGPAMAIAASSAEVLCACPDVILTNTLGQIFNKLTPVLEAGEENGLPPGHALCSLQKIRVGGMAKGFIPVPDMVLTSSYYCDMGSKTDELLREKYGHRAIYVDGCMDSRWGEFPDFSPERVAYLGTRIDNALDRVKEILGVEVTEQARHEGASRNRDVIQALSQLIELQKSADPQPISIVEVEQCRRLVAGSASRRVMTDASEAIGLLTQTVRERIDKGIGVVEKGAPRTLCHLAHQSDPRIMRMVEDCGIAVPTTITIFLSSAKVGKPVSFISGKELAELEMERGIYHGTYGLIKRCAEAAQETKVDGVIFNYLIDCRVLGQPSHLLKQFVEKETGVPVLALEMELADSRTYSAETLRTKVETFADMLRARKASRRS